MHQIVNRIRTTLRWVHIVIGVILLCYVYSPFHEYVWFQILVKFIIIPVLVVSGLWLWKSAAFNKFFKIRDF